MIEAVTGLIGGGKTLMCLYRIIGTLAQGGTVYTNILLAGYDEATKTFSSEAPICWFLRTYYNWELQDIQYRYLDEEKLKYWHKHISRGTDKNHVLVVIDEALEWLDSLDRYSLQNDPDYRQLFTFARQSRKCYVDIMLVAQDFTALNDRIRNNCQYWWTCQDMRKYRIGFIRFPFLPFFRWVCQTKKGAILYAKWVLLDPRLYALYDTTQTYCDLGIVGGVIDRLKPVELKNESEGEDMTKAERAMVGVSAIGSICACAVSIFMLANPPVLEKIVEKQVQVVGEQVAKSESMIESMIPVYEEKPFKYVEACEDTFITSGNARYRVGEYWGQGRVITSLARDKVTLKDVKTGQDIIIRPMETDNKKDQLSAGLL